MTSAIVVLALTAWPSVTGTAATTPAKGAVRFALFNLVLADVRLACAWSTAAWAVARSEAAGPAFSACRLLFAWSTEACAAIRSAEAGGAISLAYEAWAWATLAWAALTSASVGPAL